LKNILYATLAMFRDYERSGATRLSTFVESQHGWDDLPPRIQTALLDTADETIQGSPEWFLRNAQALNSPHQTPYINHVNSREESIMGMIQGLKLHFDKVRLEWTDLTPEQSFDVIMHIVKPFLGERILGKKIATDKTMGWNPQSGFGINNLHVSRALQICHKTIKTFAH
jgi:hypothetical protein